MPNSSQLLLIALLMPLLGVGVICAIAERGRSAIRQSALLTGVVPLIAAALLVVRFPGGNAPFAVTDLVWLGESSGLDIRFHVGLDGLSLWLFALTALLVVSSILVSWEAIKDRPATFYSLLLVLETGMLGLFAARDLIFFYICFEFTLIPLFLMIGIWGSEERRYAAIKFFLFTLAGSVLTFLGLLAIVLYASGRTPEGTLIFSIPQLTAMLQADPMPLSWQVWIFVALFAGFAIKVPLFPLHTWLPLAHVQAPTAGSILLAGVLLKVGTYGFVRFNMPLLPDATVVCMPYLLWLSVAGILYGALVALAQTDIKRLIAYSSVSHLGFCMLGLFAINRLGMQGGVLQMINHGLSTGGLFACVGLLYERYHTREMRELGGLARSMPVLAFFMLVFTFASIGLPGLNGFAGEFLILVGMFQRGWIDPPAQWVWQFKTIAVLAVLGVVLGAWYMLNLIQQTCFGHLKTPHHPSGQPAEPPIHDLCTREVLALAPLVVMIVWIGVVPQHFLGPMAPTLNHTTAVVERAYRESYGPEVARRPFPQPTDSAIADRLRIAEGGGDRPR